MALMDSRGVQPEYGKDYFDLKLYNYYFLKNQGKLYLFEVFYQLHSHFQACILNPFLFHIACYYV